MRLTVWGLFAALSVNVSVPVAPPVAVGENVTPTVQLAPAAILDPQDKDLMDALITSELILNKQIYCDAYLDAYRKK